MRINSENCDNEIQAILCMEQQELEYELSKDGIALYAEKSSEPGFAVKKGRDSITISYQNKSDFCRGLLTAVSKGDKEACEVREACAFEDFGIMLDMSRNAVMKPEQIKRFIRVAALMGYNFVGLYMEDTIQVEGEPYFGYMRGALTGDELKELDAYGSKFGVELRAYIQTLAHFNQITRYKHYRKITDTDDILLAGDERTYELLERLIKTVSENITSRVVNIGMDEAHMVGLGKYLDQHGYCERFGIMEAHLKRVAGICAKYGLKPQMWSDMFFRLAYGGEYYVENMPPVAIPKLPDGIELVYWDYYTTDKQRYDTMLKKHKEFAGSVAFAGGAWKWAGFTPLNGYSIQIGKEALKACVENDVKSVVITAWGDNGAESSSFSVLPCFYADAEYAFTGQLSTDKFESLTGMSFDDFMKIDIAGQFDGEKALNNNASKYLLYNDPLIGTFDSLVADNIGRHYKTAAKELKNCIKNDKYGYLFNTQRRLCKVLRWKAELGTAIKSAYDLRDKKALKEIAEETIPNILSRLDSFYDAFEEQWETENKSPGFEVQCIRFGGLKERLKYIRRVLISYCKGGRERIEELEAERLPFCYFEENDINTLNFNVWGETVSTSIIG